MLLTLEAITQKRKHERPNERTNANDRKANTFGRSLPLSLRPINGRSHAAVK